MELGNSVRGQCSVPLNPNIEIAQGPLKQKYAFGILSEEKLNDFKEQKRNSLANRTVSVDQFNEEAVKAAMNRRFDISINSNSKVDRWLNSGQNSTDHDEIETKIIAILNEQQHQNSDQASAVSSASAMRSKLLDKTAKLKANLRNKSLNKN